MASESRKTTKFGDEGRARAERMPLILDQVGWRESGAWVDEETVAGGAWMKW